MILSMTESLSFRSPRWRIGVNNALRKMRLSILHLVMYSAFVRKRSNSARKTWSEALSVRLMITFINRLASALPMREKKNLRCAACLTTPPRICQVLSDSQEMKTLTLTIYEIDARRSAGMHGLSEDPSNDNSSEVFTTGDDDVMQMDV